MSPGFFAVMSNVIDLNIENDEESCDDWDCSASELDENKDNDVRTQKHTQSSLKRQAGVFWTIGYQGKV